MKESSDLKDGLYMMRQDRIEDRPRYRKLHSLAKGSSGEIPDEFPAKEYNDHYGALCGVVSSPVNKRCLFSRDDSILPGE